MTLLLKFLRLAGAAAILLTFSLAAPGLSVGRKNQIIMPVPQTFELPNKLFNGWKMLLRDTFFGTITFIFFGNGGVRSDFSIRSVIEIT